MNLDAQVCSLELATKLKELGVKQNAYFCWFKSNHEHGYNLVEFWQVSDEPFDIISAFTIAELGELLPTRFLWKDKNDIESCENVYLGIEKYPNEYKIFYFDLDDVWFKWSSIIEDVNEANARAKMLIYLLENGLIKNGTN